MSSKFLKNSITKSDNSRILMEFFNNFDQNDGGETLAANTLNDFGIPKTKISINT